MTTRASLFVLALSAAALVAAAACSSPTGTCDAEGACFYSTDAGVTPDDAGFGFDGSGECLLEVTCYQVTDSGTCGAEILSPPCQPCPAGYVGQGGCTPAEDGGAKDGATDAPQTDGGNDAGDAATD